MVVLKIISTVPVYDHSANFLCCSIHCPGCSIFSTLAGSRVPNLGAEEREDPTALGNHVSEYTHLWRAFTNLSTTQDVITRPDQTGGEGV